jgi:hypothetical protein
MVVRPSRSSSRRARFELHRVVYGAPQLLLAAEIPLGPLDRDVLEEKLNLIELASGSRWGAKASGARAVGCGA